MPAMACQVGTRERLVAGLRAYPGLSPEARAARPAPPGRDDSFQPSAQVPPLARGEFPGAGTTAAQ